MAVMARQSWTDGRLDEFKENVNRRFDGVDRRFDEVEKRMDRRFDEVESDMKEGFARVDKDLREVRGEISQIHLTLLGMQKSMSQGVIAVCGIMVTGFGTLIGLNVF